MYRNNEGEIVIGAEGVEHDALLTKLAEARDELFGYERMVETLMINGAEYVIDEMVNEIKQLRNGLEVLQSRLIHVRGDSPREDSDITGICIQIRQLIEGKEVD